MFGYLIRMLKSRVLRLRGVHRDKYLLQLHNTRISFGMFTAVALFFPAHLPLFFGTNLQSHQTYAFFCFCRCQIGAGWFGFNTTAGCRRGGSRGSALREEESGG